MASLSDRAAKQARDLTRGPRLPEWWPLVQVGLGAVAVLFLGFAFISQVAGDAPPPAVQGVDPDAPLPVAAGGTPTTIAPEPGGPATTVADPTVPDAPVTSAPPGEGPVFGEATESVASVGGSRVQVPSAALERARAVLSASGFDMTSEPSAALSTPQRVVLNFQVDHDGDPGTPPRTIAVSVSNSGSGWVAQVG